MTDLAPASDAPTPDPLSGKLEDLGPLFHTALRKGVDSPFSSVAWNVLSLCPHEVLRVLYDEVRGSLEKADALNVATVREAFLAWDPLTRDPARFAPRSWTDPNGRQWAQLVANTLRAMPVADWASLAYAMASWLELDTSWAFFEVGGGDVAVLKDGRALLVEAVARAQLRGTVLEAASPKDTDGTLLAAGRRWRARGTALVPVTEVAHVMARRTDAVLVVEGQAQRLTPDRI